MDQFLSVTLALLKGFGQTMNIFLLTLAFSIPLGLLVCFGTMSRFSPLRLLIKAIVWVIRGTPLMLQLIVVFYGPGLLFGLPAMGRFWPSPSTTPVISARSTGAALRASPEGRSKPDRLLV